MIVHITLMLFGCAGFFVPKKYLRAYMLIASIGISSLYLFYSPPLEYDLFRHYEILHIVRKSDIQTILFGTINVNNFLISEYSDSSRIYLLYLYLIGKTNIDGMLPFITGTLIYSAASGIILMAAKDFGEEIESWKISLCFFFLLAMLDFRTISGIRNMLTFSLFAFVLYLDLVRKKNRILCFIAYFLLAGIHTSVYMLIILRLLLMVKVIPKWGKMLIAAAAFSFLDVVVSLLSRFSGIPTIALFLQKINVYFFLEGRYYFISRVLIRAFLSVFYLAMCEYLARNKYIPETLNDYLEYFLLVIFLGLGAFRQYDTFVRMHIFLYCAVSPFLLIYLKRCAGRTPNELIVPENAFVGIRETILYSCFFASIVILSYVYFNSYYTPMDYGFPFSL